MLHDPYIYPGTNVLKNLADILDSDELARFEADVVMQSFQELLRQGVSGKLNPEWYRSIHRALFGGVYPWAGSFRKINIAKQSEIVYADVRFLEENAVKIFRDLQAANYLRGLEPGVFIERLAAVMGELHVLHPFRDGNTRTLQIATAEIAYRAGHSLAWERADPTRIRSAGNAAAFFEFGPYQEILTEICAPHHSTSQKAHHNEASHPQ